MHKRRRLATRLCRVDRTTMANSCVSLLFFLAPLHFFLASEIGRAAKVQRVWEGSLVKCIQNQAPKQILPGLAFNAPQPAAWLPGQVAIAPLTVPKQLPAQHRLHQHHPMLKHVGSPRSTTHTSDAQQLLRQSLRPHPRQHPSGRSSASVPTTKTTIPDVPRLFDNELHVKRSACMES